MPLQYQHVEKQTYISTFDILLRLVSGMFTSFYFPLETSICCRQYCMQNVGKRNACCFGKQTQMSSLMENSLHIIEFHHYLFDFSRGTNFPFPLLFLIFISLLSLISHLALLPLCHFFIHKYH